MATKKSAGYQIDFTAKTLTITKEFSDNAQDPDSKEFGILMTLQNAIPGLTVIRKTHKTPESMFPRPRVKSSTVISLRT